jgi:ribosomal protein S18 acetylase RimI-like enzyme
MISYRRIVDSDYEDICDISKGIWGGNDYLPAIFNYWLHSPGYFLAAVDDEKNKVVGTGKYSILYDNSGWLEGLRVHNEYRGLKIARGISEALLNIAKEELAEGKIKRIGFGTHETNVESISLMKKLNFKLKQEFILIEGSDEINKENNFDIKTWDLSCDDFLALDYFKRRDNMVPLAFVFQEPTIELYNEFKEHNSFISINGYNGIFKIKGEPNFIAANDNFEAIDVFMKYALKLAKENNLSYPFTSVLPNNLELIEKLKTSGYNAWVNWQPDYYYFTLE